MNGNPEYFTDLVKDLLNGKHIRKLDTDELEALQVYSAWCSLDIKHKVGAITFSYLAIVLSFVAVAVGLWAGIELQFFTPDPNKLKITFHYVMVLINCSLGLFNLHILKRNKAAVSAARFMGTLFHGLIQHDLLNYPNEEELENDI